MISFTLIQNFRILQNRDKGSAILNNLPKYFSDLFLIALTNHCSINEYMECEENLILGVLKRRWLRFLTLGYIFYDKAINFRLFSKSNQNGYSV